LRRSRFLMRVRLRRGILSHESPARAARFNSVR
jgi:hypothetical protein